MLVCVLWCVSIVQIGFPRFANNPVNMKGALATVCAGYRAVSGSGLSGVCAAGAKGSSRAGAAPAARARRPVRALRLRGARGRVAAGRCHKRWRTKI